MTLAFRKDSAMEAVVPVVPYLTWTFVKRVNFYAILKSKLGSRHPSFVCDDFCDCPPMSGIGICPDEAVTECQAKSSTSFTSTTTQQGDRDDDPSSSSSSSTRTLSGGSTEPSDTTKTTTTTPNDK